MAIAVDVVAVEEEAVVAAAVVEVIGLATIVRRLDICVAIALKVKAAVIELESD